jgi:adenylate cyclase
LKQFVSEQILSELQNEGEYLIAKRQNVSVLFVDIRGFSEMAESMSPGELSELLNLYYFSPLDTIIFEYNGTLDKHIGDSIMAVFGAPKSYGDDAMRAVMSAVAIQGKIKDVNETLLQLGRPISVGIGISTGEVMAGIFGSTRKREYTVFGPSVNVASRLERLAKENQILICEDTYRQVSELITAEEMGILPLKGMERKPAIYNVTGKKEKNSLTRS